MRWFKVGAVLVGVIVAFLIVSSVVGFLIEAVIAALVVAVVVLAVKLAVNRRQVSSRRRPKEVRGRRHTGLPHRHNPQDVDDELSRLKGEMGG